MNSMSASVKLDQHVRMMRRTQYSLPVLNPDVSSLARLVNRRALAEAFLNDSDERTAIQGRVKPIHTEGVSAPIKFTATNNEYTGLYQTGFIGILRLSRAVNSTPYTYGLALKALIDGKPSVNFHAMYSLDGQGNDPNFFSNSFTTHVQPPERLLLKILAFFFHMSIPYVSPDPNRRPVNETTIPLLESATVCSDGSLVDPRAPAKLLFVPKVSLDAGTDFRTDIVSQIKAHSELYDVYDNDTLLGTISTTDDFIMSSHGDNMHFKHQRMSGTCPFFFRLFI